MLLAASYCPTARPALLLRSVSLFRSAVGSEGYYFFHLTKKNSQEFAVKKMGRDKRRRWRPSTAVLGGGRAHAVSLLKALIDATCMCLQRTLQASRGEEGEGEVGWGVKTEAVVQTIDLLPYFNPKKEGKKQKKE